MAALGNVMRHGFDLGLGSASRWIDKYRPPREKRMRERCVYDHLQNHCSHQLKSAFPGPLLAMARLVLDVRERSLIHMFNERAEGHHIEALAVGDIQCEYASGQRGWVVERKSAHDLAASLCDNRYREQRSRLLECNLRPIYIIEGDLRHTLLYHNIMPAIVNLQLRGVDVFRTFDIEETFCLLVLLVEKLESPPPRGITAVETGIKPPRSKREREASPRTSLTRMLRCVPGVSQDAADCLANHFKTLPALQRALEADTPFPKIQLRGGQYLGKIRLKRLRTYLLEAQLETQT
jgi:ERCC4-type nuclease